MSQSELTGVWLSATSIEEVAPAMEVLTCKGSVPVVDDRGPPIFSRRSPFAVGSRLLNVAEPIDAETPVGTGSGAKGSGLTFITLETSDLDARVNQLRREGFELVPPGELGESAERAAFVPAQERTHGLAIELREIASEPREPAPREREDCVAPLSLNEVHCAVRDADEASSRLAEVLGLEVGPPVVQVQPPEEVRFRNLYGNGHPALALIQPASKTSAIARFLARRGEGFFSLSLRVPDVERYVTQLQRAGIRPLLDRPSVVHDTRIGPHQIARNRINWIPPQPALAMVLFELQEYDAPS